MRNIDRFKTPEPVADVPALHHVIHGGPAITDPCCVWSAAYNLLVKRACKDHLPAFAVCDGSSAPTAWLCARFYGHHAVLTPFHVWTFVGRYCWSAKSNCQTCFSATLRRSAKETRGRYDCRFNVWCLIVSCAHVLYCRMDEYGLDCVTPCIAM